MPHSAVTSGCVDFVLPPDQIGRELARIAGHPYLSHIPTYAEPAKVKEAVTKQESFERIFALLRASGGINFSQYKPGTVQRRTLRRMAIHKIDRVSDYAKYLEKHLEETDNLCQDLLIPVTSFFRDLEAFEALKSKVFPAILKRFNLSGAGSGVGLAGMRERMRELGGRLEIESDDGGTVVRAIIPVAESANAKKAR
jgi:two-component system CheB/CheR fusion protein